MHAVSKAEFARMIERSAGRVSQYIRDGKISPGSLTDDGKVIVEMAKRDLGALLHVGQAYGANGLHGARGHGDAQASDEILRQKLEQARLQTREMRRKEQLAIGRYVLAEEARRSMAQIALRVVQALEGQIPTMAQAMADALDKPSRDVRVALRSAMRAAREGASASIAEEARSTAATSDDILNDESGLA